MCEQTLTDYWQRKPSDHTDKRTSGNSGKLMADLHYGDYGSKQKKNIFYVLKIPSLEQFSP